ncbi:dockerin type I repeat-containing protein [Ruminiclostridium josui]|uniref:dockerin type I repeat-containing protein n=1 Tax=Ruminiclostridium josui TaxID=1499 RepID=UPI00046624A0|nr:dockerin type I repeat-containing protein [Ruminiclostridium josui]
MYCLRKTKVFFSMILVLTLLIACCTFPAAAQEDGLVIGDANGDGKVNLVDLTLLNRYISGTINTFPYYMADYTMDVNNDGYINKQDADLLYSFLSGSLASLPAADIIKNMPQTVFQWGYVNGAWIYTNLKVTIDKQGNVYANGTIAPKVNPSTIKVPKIELEAMYMDLYLASEGVITKPMPGGCDMGLSTYSGNIIKNGNIQNVFLMQHGDIEQENLSPFTQTLVDWLDGYVNMLY